MITIKKQKAYNAKMATLRVAIFLLIKSLL